jgi:conjugative transposon TraM protein
MMRMNYEVTAGATDKNRKQVSNKVQQSQSNLRKRKMLLMLPILVIPFMTVGFWALGGGKDSMNVTNPTADKEGLNLHLPDPKLKKETVLDKLGFYDKADKDSVKLKEEIRNDPYYHKLDNPPASDLEDIAKSSADKFNEPSLLNNRELNTSPYNTSTDQSEKKLMQKLSELNKVINQSQPTTSKMNSYEDIDKSIDMDAKSDNHIAQLEGMMQSLNQPGEGDGEIKQLSLIMDKILDVQHPERVAQQLKEKQAQQSPGVFAISNKAATDTVVNGFYSLDDLPDTTKSNAVEAVVNENQTLVNGAIIKLRLVKDTYIKDVRIPAGNFVYGTVSLNGERLNVEINSIRNGSSVYPVKMELYDMDGLPGIYIPGAITRDVVKQSADNSLQTMELATLDPSLAAQATAAGISTVKNLLSKKVKLVKVMVKAGYKVLLQDKSNQ